LGCGEFIHSFVIFNDNNDWNNKIDGIELFILSFYRYIFSTVKKNKAVNKFTHSKARFARDLAKAYVINGRGVREFCNYPLKSFWAFYLKCIRVQ
jgi:hypothetical protein